MTWARFAHSPDMHSIALLHEHTVTAECRKTFPSYDAVEVDKQPEHERRCPDCCRVLVDRRWIELGLEELRDAPAEVS